MNNQYEANIRSIVARQLVTDLEQLPLPIVAALGTLVNALVGQPQPQAVPPTPPITTTNNFYRPEEEQKEAEPEAEPEQQAKKQRKTPERLLSAADVAEYLQVHQSTIYNRMRAGEIPCVKVGKTVRFRQSEVDAYLDKTTAPTPPTSTPPRTEW